MSLRPGTATTITRTKGNYDTANTTDYGGIGKGKQTVTKDPPTPLEYGRQHLSPGNIGTVS